MTKQDVALQRFDADLRKFAKKMDLDITIVTKKIAIDLFRAIVSKNPVLSGRSRGSWNINAGQPDLTVQPAGSSNRNSQGGDLAGGLSQLAPYEKVFITNNLPYIGELEDGSSTQAPQGMVKVSIQETKTFLGEVLRGGL